MHLYVKHVEKNPLDFYLFLLVVGQFCHFDDISRVDVLEEEANGRVEEGRGWSSYGRSLHSARREL